MELIQGEEIKTYIGIDILGMDLKSIAGLQISYLEKWLLDHKIVNKVAVIAEVA